MLKATCSIKYQVHEQWMIESSDAVWLKKLMPVRVLVLALGVNGGKLNAFRSGC